jgi:hypothetical protein
MNDYEIHDTLLNDQLEKKRQMTLFSRKNSFIVKFVFPIKHVLIDINLVSSIFIQNLCICFIVYIYN